MSILDRLLLMLAAAVAVVSIAEQDWMWLVVAALGAALTAYPAMKVGQEYNTFLSAMAIVPLAAQVAAGIAVFLYGRTEGLWTLSLIFQTWACVVFGYMLALIIDKSTGIILSKRWILLFSLLFSLSISAIYLFFQFGSMYLQGMPVFNTDFQGIEMDETRIWMNSQLMTPPTVAVPVSIVVAIILRYWTKKTEKSELMKEVA
ncbi:MAG: hypothetical protein AB7S83_06305 [Candidatus Methanomethylophilaceae archaeon]|jgi:hypothetical protein